MKWKNKKTYQADITNKYDKVTYTVIFAILFLTSGFGISHLIGGTGVILGCVVFTIILIFLYGKNNINMCALICCLFLIFNIMITTLYHNDSLKQFIIYAAFLLVGFCISQILKKNFNVFYVKLMYFLAAISIAMLCVYIISPKLIYYLPTIPNKYGLKAYTIFFSTITSFGNMSFPRNQGFFWEPGAYQTFLNIAAIITLFSKEITINRKKYITIIGIAIATTFSTTGYITFLGIIITYFYNEIITSKTKKKIYKIILIGILIIMVFFVVYSCLPYSVKFQLFGKLYHYIDNTNMITSTSIRVGAIEKAIEGFLNYPLIGSGYSKLNVDLNDRTAIMTCTPLNFFAYYGLFFGIISNLGIFLYSKSITKKTSLSILIFICLLISMISENYMQNPLLLTIIFLGLSNTKNQKELNLNEVEQ